MTGAVDVDLDAPGIVRDEVAHAAVDAYFEHGAGRGTTVALNAAAWAQWAIVPRMFRDVRAVDTSVTLLGLDLAAPILAAPSAGHGLAHAAGERATATGVSAAGSLLVLSQGSSQTIEDVAQLSGPYLQQIYLPRERDLLWPFLDRVVAAGARGLVLTVDQPAVGNSYAFRSGLGAVIEREGSPASANFPGIDHADLATDAHVRPEDIGALARRTGLPVLVKGVLHPDDASLAVDAGAAGVIVSNHGGRQIDGSITTAEALPDIAAAVGSRVPVLVDGGIRTGEDMLRALALGASAVLVGRPVVRALRLGGAAAVTAALDDLRTSFATVLAMTGTRDVQAIRRDLVRRRTFGHDPGASL